MALSTQTDTEVFLAMRSGDLSALDILYQRYGKVVYCLALRIIGQAQEAEDLTQEVFLALWHGCHYDPKRGSMLVFLTTMSRAKALDCHRRRRTQLLQRWSRSMNSEDKRPLMDEASLAEISHRVREALLELPPRQRQVLLMAYYDGRSQSEIAQDLNIPLGTVKTNKRLALFKLRQILKDLVE